MDYKMIHPNGSPFSYQERKSEQTARNNANISSKLINMIISLFK